MTLHLTVTRQGTNRTENRDITGSAHNTGVYLYVIADGTSKLGSSELARTLAQHVLTSFSRVHPSDISCPDKTLELTLISLNEVRSTLCSNYPVASTSYLVLLVHGQTAISIHAGDCCLGRIEEDLSVNWLSPPHCVLNWKGDQSHDHIASSPARKTLWNCMSYRRPHEPHIQSLQTIPDTKWILATDGFWAELSTEKQLNAIASQSLDDCPSEDDITFMLLQP
ncbi:protein phosphatase 2C family protein [Pseudomonas sp. CCM 7893]|uniref:Protein phosphatase 2C family protein n=1 Tax=Pseudomonas spelaei TaxID=1055469 RepID=A0A6I3WBN2_9PSED|nr:protein phosphatase 2C family protein [Pseudomonas spelaei]MUF08130.1 protein phosphatase 2C family protein [Pseudomonas spelaei]